MNKDYFREIFSRAAMVLRLAANDFKSKYAGSVLGILWAIAEPLVTVAVYWFVYTVAFRGEMTDGIPYHIWLSVGIAPWFFISDGVRGITACFRDYSFLIKKTCFDSRLLPWVRGASALISHLIFLGLVLILCAAEGISLSGLIYLPGIMFLTAAFVMSIGKVLALACACFKDILNAVTIVLNIGFWMTPVFWSMDGVPMRAAAFLRLNPAAILVESYRSAILFGRGMNLYECIYLLGICIIFAVIGTAYQRTVLPNISDNL